MEIITYEIEQRFWPAYFGGLVRLYRGWAVTIEVLSRELGDQRVAEGLELQGVSFDPVGSEAGDIMFEAGDLPDFTIHHVDRPRIVRLAHTRPGFESDIQIESEDGTITLVVLRRRPELPPPPAHNGDL